MKSKGDNARKELSTVPGTGKIGWCSLAVVDFCTTATGLPDRPELVVTVR